LVLFSTLIKFYFNNLIIDKIQPMKGEFLPMKNLKYLRNQYNLSQQKLADILHISQQSVYKYENGITTPDLETLMNMANYFETSVDYIIGNTEIPHKLEPLTNTMLNNDEVMLITDYRKLSQSQRSVLKSLMFEFIKQNSI